MKCVKCGAPLEADSVFCPHCGSKQTVMNTASTTGWFSAPGGLEDPPVVETNYTAPARKTAETSAPRASGASGTSGAPRTSGASRAPRASGTFSAPRVPSTYTEPVEKRRAASEKKSEPRPSAVQASPVNPYVDSALPAKAPSYFDGSLLGLIGVGLVVFFVSLITFGLAYPALFCYQKRWHYSHTVINGYRLKFTGTGMQLIGKHLLWTLLTIVTIGIYGLWLPIKYRKWETKHVEIDSKVI